MERQRTQTIEEGEIEISQDEQSSEESGQVSMSSQEDNDDDDDDDDDGYAPHDVVHDNSMFVFFLTKLHFKINFCFFFSKIK